MRSAHDFYTYLTNGFDLVTIVISTGFFPAFTCDEMCDNQKIFSLSDI